MAIGRATLKYWVDSLKEGDEIYIDEGGLTLQSVKSPCVYLEVGGAPEPYEIYVEPDSTDEKETHEN